MFNFYYQVSLLIAQLGSISYLAQLVGMNPYTNNNKIPLGRSSITIFLNNIILAKRSQHYVLVRNPERNK